MQDEIFQNAIDRMNVYKKLTDPPIRKITVDDFLKWVIKEYPVVRGNIDDSHLDEPDELKNNYKKDIMSVILKKKKLNK